MEQDTLVTAHHQVVDRVNQGETLAGVETDNVTSVRMSTQARVVMELLAAGGAEVVPGQVEARVGPE